MELNELLSTIEEQIDDYESQIVHNNRLIDQLTKLMDKLKVSGISKADYGTVSIHGSNVEDKFFNLPIRTFTDNPSQTNLVPALEEISTFIDFLKKAIINAYLYIKELIEKLINNFFNTNKESDTAAMKEHNNDYRKVITLIGSKDKKVVKEVEADIQRKQFEETHKTKELAKQETAQRRSHYTILARALATEPNKITTLLGYYKELPDISLMLSVVVDFLFELNKDIQQSKKEEDFVNVQAKISTTVTDFRKALIKITRLISSVKIDSIYIRRFNPDYPEIVLDSFYQEYKSASITPAAVDFRDDFKTEASLLQYLKSRDKLITDIEMVNLHDVKIKRDLTKIQQGIDKLTALNTINDRLIEASSNEADRVIRAILKESITAISNMSRTLIKLKEIPFLMYEASEKHMVAEIRDKTKLYQLINKAEATM